MPVQEVSVSVRGSQALSRGGGHCPRKGSLSGGGISVRERGYICLQGGGGICPVVSVPGGCLSMGSLYMGVSVQCCLCPRGSLSGVSVQGGSLSGEGVIVQGGLCPRGVSARGVSVQGSLSRGISVMDTPYGNMWVVCILLQCIFVKYVMGNQTTQSSRGVFKVVCGPSAWNKLMASCQTVESS